MSVTTVCTAKPPGLVITSAGPGKMEYTRCLGAACERIAAVPRGFFTAGENNSTFRLLLRGGMTEAYIDDMGEMGATTLDNMIKQQAEDGVYVSIVAMGAEFNSSLTDAVCKNKGFLLIFTVFLRSASHNPRHATS